MKGDRLSKVRDNYFAITYTLTPNRLVIHLFGMIPLHNIHLADVAYLRLASREEVPPLFYLRNMRHFRPAKAAHCPVYVLKTKKRGQRVYLKLRAGSHFRLRSAIGRHRKEGTPHPMKLPPIKPQAEDSQPPPDRSRT